MTNPPEDPGHRPPPPRQGEHAPYPGGYGPPPQPGPTPGPGWQQQGQGGYGPPQAQPYAPPPRTGKGFFGTLFDFDFDEMVTTRLVKVVYVLAVVLFSLTSIFMLLVGLWMLQFSWGKYFGVFIVPAAPLLWVFEIVVTRMTLEFVINQFKITEHLKAMREGKR